MTLLTTRASASSGLRAHPSGAAQFAQDALIVIGAVLAVVFFGSVALGVAHVTGTRQVVVPYPCSRSMTRALTISWVAPSAAKTFEAIASLSMN